MTQTLVFIQSPLYDNATLRAAVGALVESQESAGQAALAGHPGSLRNFEASVVISVVGMVGTVLGSLSTGLLKVLADRGGRKIVITTADGIHLEVAAGTDPEEVARLLRTLNDAMRPKIRLG